MVNDYILVSTDKEDKYERKSVVVTGRWPYGSD